MSKLKKKVGYRSGTQFKDGKIFEFSRYTITVMKGWPKPLAWKRTTRKPWRAVRPLNVPLVPFLPDISGKSLNRNLICSQFSAKKDLEGKERGITPYDKFIAQVPDRVWYSLAQYQDRQWHMFSLFARCPESLDLAENNPSLAYCLGSSWVFKEKPVKWHLRSVRSIIKSPQRDILKWMDWPGNNSTVKILRKLSPFARNIGRLFYLRNALSDSTIVKQLSHLQSINNYITHRSLISEAS
jgi:hypothetical protein